MPWATPLHTSGPPESPCGQREQGLSSPSSGPNSPSSGLVSLPPWGGWAQLGVLVDIRALLVLRFTLALTILLLLLQEASPICDCEAVFTPQGQRTGWGQRGELCSHGHPSSQLSWAQGFAKITPGISPRKNPSFCLDLQHISA